MSNITTKKYLDYEGLTYFTTNHVIDKQLGTAKGDILYVSAFSAGTSGSPNTVTWSKLAIGSTNQVLKVGSGGVPVWGSDAGMINPMTTQYDIIYGGTSGAPTRLGKGSNYTLLGINSSGALAYNSLNSLTVSYGATPTVKVYNPFSASHDLDGITFKNADFDCSVSAQNNMTIALSESVVMSCSISGTNNPSVSHQALTLPDIQSIPNTGSDSIESLFS